MCKMLDSLCSGLIGSIAAAVIAVYYASKVFLWEKAKDYQKLNYNDAHKLKRLFEQYKGYIVKIAQMPGLFEYEGYYPFSFPEQSQDKHHVRYKERPMRLIHNETEKFILKASGLMDRLDMNKDCLGNLRTKSTQISGAIAKSMEKQQDNSAKVENFDNLKQYVEELEKICSDIIVNIDEIIKQSKT